MKVFRLLVIIAFALMLLLSIGCGQKEEAQPEQTTNESMVEETADSMQGEMEQDTDSMQNEAEEMTEEATGH